MMKSTYYCDRCKQVVSAARTELDVLSGPIRQGVDTESLDLCANCARAFLLWLSAPALSHAPAFAEAVA